MQRRRQLPSAVDVREGSPEKDTFEKGLEG